MYSVHITDFEVKLLVCRQLKRRPSEASRPEGVAEIQSTEIFDTCTSRCARVPVVAYAFPSDSRYASVLRSTYYQYNITVLIQYYSSTFNTVLVGRGSTTTAVRKNYAPTPLLSLRILVPLFRTSMQCSKDGKTAYPVPPLTVTKTLLLWMPLSLCILIFHLQRLLTWYI